jgi:two-component system phosphate regulon sensor histidine kinase PhoR
VRDPELAKAIEKTQSKHTFSKVEFETAHDLDRRTISARVSVLPQPEQNDQNPPGFLAILNDITELRQLETMRRDFVANVSHELKTPLASIKAYAETLRLGAINDKQKNIKFVKEIEKQAEVLHQQILDLLQIARIESGKEVWDIEPVDINRQCEQVVARFSKLAEDSNLTIETNLSDEFPQARADVEGLATILNNLVTNSLNYTPAGGKITVSTHYRGNSAIAEIADTGIGIEAEHQTRIFERFYRVDKARSRDNGGTGLGLAIVKHLAQSFGGSVELESEIGKGTRIRIRLPKFVT